MVEKFEAELRIDYVLLIGEEKEAFKDVKGKFPELLKDLKGWGRGHQILSREEQSRNRGSQGLQERGLNWPDGY